MARNSLGFSISTKKYSSSNHHPKNTVKIVNDETRIFRSKLAYIRNSMYRKPKPSPMTKVTESIFVGGFEDAILMSEEYALILLVENNEIKYHQEILTQSRNILWIPTPDFSTPTALQMNNALVFAQMHSKVIIACKSGKGRSVLCAAYILSSLESISIKDAYNLISSKRPNVDHYSGWFGVNEKWKYIEHVKQHTP